METCDLKGANRTAVVVAEVRSICWLPDRRIVYSQGKRVMLTPIFGKSALTRLPNTIGKPKRITRWAGADLQGMSASADGKRIVLQKETYPSQVYIGELAAGGRPMSPSAADA